MYFSEFLACTIRFDVNEAREHRISHGDGNSRSSVNHQRGGRVSVAWRVSLRRPHPTSVSCYCVCHRPQWIDPRRKPRRSFSIIAIPPALLLLLVLAAVRGAKQQEGYSPTMAIVSSAFLFLAVVLVTYLVLFTLGDTTNIGYWSIGGGVATAVAFLSFRQSKKRGASVQ